MWYDSKKDNADLEFCVLEETIPPCPECEKHFFHQQQTFNLLEAGVVVVSILTLVTDIVTDTLVTCQYFASGEYCWGLLTLGFMLLPSVCIQFFSLRWYQVDEDLSAGKWIVHGLQLGPLYRYFVVLQTGMMAKRSQDPLDFELLYHQQSDVCMLRLFESFMESAPQVVLQLYIMVATNEENFFTGISAMVSIVSLCWAIAVYSRIHRRVRDDKKVVSWPGVILQAVWRIGMISSRVIALVLFATVFKAYVFLVIAIHWFAMMVWVVLQNTDFCLTWLEERLFNAVIAVVYIFCFFNLKEGTSRHRVLVFYSVMFVENVLFLVLWNSAALEREIYTEVGFSIVFGGFFIGVTSMVLYYRYLHPHSSVVGCCSGGSTTTHQPCLQHEDVLIKYPHKGLEAEISPRSQSPSPHALFNQVHRYSPLALPISEFNTLGSYTTTPGLKRPASSASVSRTGGIVNEVKGHQRARSESCLLQDRSASVQPEEGLFAAKSLCGLPTESNRGHLPEWVGHFVNERKGFTREFVYLLTPDILGHPLTGDLVDGPNSEAGNDHAESQDHRPHAVSQVDSVSKKLFKGSADRRMHRSFRRQLQYEGADKDRVTPTGPNEKLLGPHRRTAKDFESARSSPMTQHGRISEESQKRTPNCNNDGLHRGTPECRRIPQGNHVTQRDRPLEPLKGTPWAQQKPTKGPKVGQRVPKELLKLPENNVRSKLKVFEALGIASTSLTASGSKKGSAVSSLVTPAGSEQVYGSREAVVHGCPSSQAEPPGIRRETSVIQDRSLANRDIQRNSQSSTMDSQSSISGTAQPATSAELPGERDQLSSTTTPVGNTRQKSGAEARLQRNESDQKHHDEKPTTNDDVNGVGAKASHESLDLEQKRDEPDMVLPPTCHVTEEASARISPRSAVPCPTEDAGKLVSPGVKIDPSLNVPAVRVSGGELSSSPEQFSSKAASRDIGQNSPLREIQSTNSSFSRVISASSGKENQGVKARKSFGNVKIKDIKESIANSPKKDLKKSRMSFSRIPADIVAKRVSSLVSTPEQ